MERADDIWTHSRHEQIPWLCKRDENKSRTEGIKPMDPNIDSILNTTASAKMGMRNKSK
jgi:hypothetical protein